MFETWYKMSTMLQNSQDVSAVITHHFKFGGFQKGFDILNSVQSGKVISDWDNV